MLDLIAGWPMKSAWCRHVRYRRLRPGGGWRTAAFGRRRGVRALPGAGGEDAV